MLVICVATFLCRLFPGARNCSVEDEVSLHHADSQEGRSNLPTFDDLCITLPMKSDDELFSRAMRLPNHVLHALIPPQSPASQIYNIMDIADTHYNCHHTPHACQTLTSLHECSIKTNIRHATLELLLCILCLLCILGLRSVMPLINED